MPMRISSILLDSGDIAMLKPRSSLNEPIPYDRKRDELIREIEQPWYGEGKYTN